MVSYMSCNIKLQDTFDFSVFYMNLSFENTPHFLFIFNVVTMVTIDVF